MNITISLKFISPSSNSSSPDIDHPSELVRFFVVIIVVIAIIVWCTTFSLYDLRSSPVSGQAIFDIEDDRVLSIDLAHPFLFPK